MPPLAALLGLLLCAGAAAHAGHHRDENDELGERIDYGRVIPIKTDEHGHGHGHDHGHDHDHDHDHKHTQTEGGAHAHDHHDDHHHGHDHGHGHDHTAATERSPNETWLRAIGATCLISSASLVTIPFLPILSQPGTLKIGMAFAVGGLLGDVFLHIIPHEMGGGHSHDEGEHSHHDHDHAHGHDHDHGHEGHSHGWADVRPGMLIIGGIVIFLMIDKMMRGMMGVGAASGHGHSHGGGTTDKKTDQPISDQKTVAKSTAILNLVADATHNFTDGLAIGVAFGRGQNEVATTLAVLLHELPHEVGDVAILVAAGYRPSQAVKMQFMTALGAMAGTIAGLLSGTYFKEAADMIGLVTAGGFLYVAMVTVLPSLLDETSFWQSIWEVMAIGAGVGLMVLVVYFE